MVPAILWQSSKTRGGRVFKLPAVLMRRIVTLVVRHQGSIRLSYAPEGRRCVRTAGRIRITGRGFPARQTPLHQTYSELSTRTRLPLEAQPLVHGLKTTAVRMPSHSACTSAAVMHCCVTVQFVSYLRISILRRFGDWLTGLTEKSLASFNRGWYRSDKRYLCKQKRLGIIPRRFLFATYDIKVLGL